DIYLRRGAELRLRDLHLVQINTPAIRRDAPHHGVAHGARLLKDLFEHEVLEAALLRHNRVPGYVLHLACDGIAVEIRERNTARRDYSKVAIRQEEKVARVIQDRRHVA